MNFSRGPSSAGWAARVWSWRLLPFLGLLWLYKHTLSPFLPRMCRYEPTCSVYMFQAIQQRGLLQGVIIGLLRLSRCAPWGGCGYDPVEAFRWPWQKPPAPAEHACPDHSSHHGG